MTVTKLTIGDVAVTRVEFYLDNVLQSTVAAPPYAWSWNTAGSSNGSHALTAKAYDAAGNVGTSAAMAAKIALAFNRYSRAMVILSVTNCFRTVISEVFYF